MNNLIKPARTYFHSICFLLISIFFVSCSSQSTRPPTVEEKKAGLYFEEGTNLLVEKNFQEAMINFLKAKELDPKREDIRINLATSYYLRKQPELAIGELKELLSQNPKNTRAKQNLAVIFLEKKQINDAKKLLQEALKDLTYRELEGLHYNLAIAYLKEGDRYNAIEELKLSLKEKDYYCPAHFKLGEIYSEEFKYQSALESFKDSVKGTCFNDVKSHYHIAVTHLNLNQKKLAESKFQYIVEKFPKTEYSVLAQKELQRIARSSAREEELLKTELLPNQQFRSPEF